MLTHEQLADISQRAEAATPGPWMTVQPGGPNGSFWSICNQNGNIIALRLSQSPEDAAFIAAARADIPALLNAVDRLRAERTTADVASVRWEQESGRLQQENAQLRAALAEITQINGDDPTMRRIEQIIAQHR